MTGRTTERRDALLRELDPLAPDERTTDQYQDGAWLLALAAAHPREDEPERADTRAGGWSRARRSAIALGLAVTAVAGGGVAVATTGAWDEIASSWNDMMGHDPRYQAGPPQLVARGTGTSSNAGPTGRLELQLWAAPTANGGQCASIRAQGFSLDTCGDNADDDPQPSRPMTGLTGPAYYQVLYTSPADYLWGHVDPGQVSTITVTAPDRETVSTPVDRKTGYWVTSIVDTTVTSTLTLTALDADGSSLLAQTVPR